MNEKERKRNFVAKLSEVLNMAKPHLTCEYKLGEELPEEERWVDNQLVKYQPQGEFVIVTCENGYQYKINVSADSMCAIAEAVFTKMCCK